MCATRCELVSRLGVGCHRGLGGSRRQLDPRTWGHFEREGRLIGSLPKPPHPDPSQIIGSSFAWQLASSISRSIKIDQPTGDGHDRPRWPPARLVLPISIPPGTRLPNLLCQVSLPQLFHCHHRLCSIYALRSSPAALTTAVSGARRAQPSTASPSSAPPCYHPSPPTAAFNSFPLL